MHANVCLIMKTIGATSEKKNRIFIKCFSIKWSKFICFLSTKKCICFLRDVI